MFFCRCRRVWQKHHCKADEDSSCRRLQCWVSYKCIPMPGFCPSLVGSKISGFKCWYVLLSWTCGVKDVGLKSRICEGVVNRFSETQTYLVLISSISPRFILSKKSHMAGLLENLNSGPWGLELVTCDLESRTACINLMGSEDLWYTLKFVEPRTSALNVDVMETPKTWNMVGLRRLFVHSWCCGVQSLCDTGKLLCCLDSLKSNMFWGPKSL